MKTLPHVLEDYLTLRRAMGFKLSEAGTLLPQFVAYLAQRGHTFITTAEAVEWATQPQHVQPAEGARRLRWVRGFARYHHASDPRTEIPPQRSCRTVRNVVCRISTVRPRLPNSWRLPAASPPPWGS